MSIGLLVIFLSGAGTLPGKLGHAIEKFHSGECRKQLLPACFGEAQMRQQDIQPTGISCAAAGEEFQGSNDRKLLECQAYPRELYLGLFRRIVTGTP
jgi:hypothetical protein